MKLPIPRKLLVLLCVAISVSGCSSITGGRKVDYKSAASRSELEIPPDLTGLPTGRGGRDVTTFSGYAAEQAVTQGSDAKVLPTYARVTLEREGNQRWLVVSEKAEKVWPQLREFIFGMGLAIARENRTTGVIETDWAENRAGLSSGGWFSKLFSRFRDTGVRDRYRIRVEEGKQPGTVDIHLTHQGLVEVVASGGGDQIVQTLWQPRDSDKELEAEMLRLLMVHLGVEDAKARSMLTVGVGLSRATLEFDQNDVASLRTSDPFYSAWRRVAKALDRLDVEIEKKEEKKGEFLIRVTDAKAGKDKPGFFARMLGKKKAGSKAYRLRVVASGKGTEIQLLERDAERRISSVSGKVFIKRLYEEIR